jgi:hypothetical protein
MIADEKSYYSVSLDSYEILDEFIHRIIIKSCIYRYTYVQYVVMS